MAAPIVQVGATILCPHGGQASIASANTRVMVTGQPAALATDPCVIAGCPFALPSGSPAPCLTVQWTTVSTRVQVNGTPLVLANSQGMCAGVGPPGPPSIASTQSRVKAT